MTDETTNDRDNDLWTKANSPFSPPSEQERALAELAEASEGDLGDADPEPADRSADPTDTWAASPFAPTASRREKGAAGSDADTETETWDRSTSPFAPDAARKRAAASEERDKQTTVRSDYGEDDDLTAGQLIDLAETCSIGLTDLLNSISDPEKRKEVENAAIAWGRA
jgi:hypothetical protein